MIMRSRIAIGPRRARCDDRRGGTAGELSQGKEAGTGLATLKTPYEEHRPYVLAVLARRCGWLGDDEREAVFHDAYALMLEKEREGTLEPDAMHPHQVRAYLTQTAVNKALDEGKRAERRRTEPIGERALAEPDPGTAPEEATASRMEGATAREIVAELPARRQAVVKLRFFFERSPEEIQRMLHISPRTYRRELERGLRHVADRFELVREGRFCETRRELILAYVAGSADPREAANARTHLANCPGCSHWAAELRRAAEDVAAVIPLPVLLAEPGRIGDAFGAAQDLAGNVAAWIKQQVPGIAARLDPAPLSAGSSARPGTVAALVAGCIAAGGGATYCAVEGVGPVDGLLGGDPPIRAERRPPPPEPSRTPLAPRAVKAKPKPVAREPAPKPEPQPTEEFTPEGGGEPVAESLPSAQSIRSAPAASASTRAGEFGP
jgi:RNA polymerase sigma factor (sigma-70 family)